MRVLETDRLTLRWLAVEDAEFICASLMSLPSFVSSETKALELLMTPATIY